MEYIQNECVQFPTLQSLADYMEIPKYTLLYWEREGLIHFGRNPHNNYRQVSPSTILEIESTTYLRNAGVSIEEIKGVQTMNLAGRKQLYAAVLNRITSQMKQLMQTETLVKNHLDRMTIIQTLMKYPYQMETPDFKKIVIRSQNRKAALVEQRNPYRFVLYRPDGQSDFIDAFIDDDAAPDDVLWECQNDTGTWRTFILQVEAENVHRKGSNLQENLNALHTKGFSTGPIVAHFMEEAFENKKLYIYYKAYVLCNK